jgi:hypothetical protein
VGSPTLVDDGADEQPCSPSLPPPREPSSPAAAKAPAPEASPPPPPGTPTGSWQTAVGGQPAAVGGQSPAPPPPPAGQSPAAAGGPSPKASLSPLTSAGQSPAAAGGPSPPTPVGESPAAAGGQPTAAWPPAAASASSGASSPPTPEQPSAPPAAGAGIPDSLTYQVPPDVKDALATANALGDIPPAIRKKLYMGLRPEGEARGEGVWAVGQEGGPEHAGRDALMRVLASQTAHSAKVRAKQEINQKIIK